MSHETPCPASSAALPPGRFVMRAVALVFLLALAGCASDPPEPLALGDVSEWKTFTNDEVGYTFQYPAEFEARLNDDGRNVTLRYDGYPLVAVHYCDEAEAGSRGLWADHAPEADVELSRRTGKLYRYTHRNIGAQLPVLSFVVPHREKFLGLEFRVRGELDPVLQRIRQTFRFL